MRATAAIASGLATPPVGLSGETIEIAFVRGVTARAIASGSSR